MKILDLIESDDVMNSKEYKALVRQEQVLIKRYKATRSDIKRTMLDKQISDISSKKAALLGESEDCEELKALMKKGMTREEAQEMLKGKAKGIGDGNGPYRDGKGPHGARRPFKKGVVKQRLRQRFAEKLEDEFLEEAFNEIQMLNEEWYDAYRDFKGQGMSDAEARKEADKMYGKQEQKSFARKTPNRKPVLDHMRFYNIKKNEEKRAKMFGLKQTKNGKWYIGVYNTSGLKTKKLIKSADAEFGKGRDWKPNKK